MCILTREQSLKFEELVKNLPNIYENNPDLFKNLDGFGNIKLPKIDVVNVEKLLKNLKI